MYRIVIADDERIVREGLATTIEWNHYGFKVSGFAGDGEEALEMVKKYTPHLLITDIRMPKMDGVELLKQAKALVPDLCVIMLTAMNDFSYAKESLNAGAFSYILKSEIFKELDNALEKARCAIEAGARDEEADDLAQMQEQARKKVMLGERYCLPAEVDVSAFSNYRCGVSVLTVDGYYLLKRDGGLRQLNEINSVLDELCREVSSPPAVICFAENLSDSKFAVIFFHRCDTEFSESYIRMRLEEIRNKLLGMKLLIASGNIYSGWEGVEKSALEAQKRMTRLTLAPGDSIPPQDPALEEEIINCTLQGRPIDSYEELIYAYLASFLADDDINEKKLAYRCNRLCHKVHDHVAGILPDNAAEAYDYSLLSDCRTFHDMYAYLCDFLSATGRLIVDLKQADSMAACIKFAQGYVEDNLNKKIRLADVAKLTFISPSYFSSVFKERMGRNFSDYVAERKIRQAAELIKAGHTVQYAMTATGYDDIKHFRTIFSKYIGVKPGELKSTHEKNR